MAIEKGDGQRGGEGGEETVTARHGRQREGGQNQTDAEESLELVADAQGDVEGGGAFGSFSR